MHFPFSEQAPFILAILGLIAVAFQTSWAATYLIAPAALLLLREIKPELATGRVLLLFFLAPSSYLLDLYFGESIQIATAAASSMFAQLFNGELGIRTGNELWCDPHKIFVTSACSGARLAVRIVALALFVASLKRSHPRIVLCLIFIGLVLSVVTNTMRIGILCLAAPGYAAEDFLGMERYHDISGVVAFFIAYVILAWANSRLTTVYLDTDDLTQ
jgi:exosortase/archaeosortase family protein